MTDQRRRLAFLGGGLASSVGYAHRAAAELDSRWTVAGGVFSRDPLRSSATSEAWGIPVDGVCADIQQVVDRASGGEFDAVAVLTPTPDHVAALRTLLDAGVPIICEKAMTTSARDSAEIVERHARHGGFLATTLNYTGYPMLRELRARILRGDLGRLLRIDIRMPQETFLLPPGASASAVQSWRRLDYAIPTISLDLGVHMVEISRFLHDAPITELVATSGSFGDLDVIDDTQAFLRFADGAVGSLWSSKVALGNRNGLAVEVYGDDASALWIQERPDVIEIRRRDRTAERVDRGSLGLLEADAPRYVRFKAGHPTGFIEAFANLYVDLADAILEMERSGRGEQPLHPFIADPTAVHYGMTVLDAMVVSSRTSEWTKVSRIPEREPNG